MGAGLGAYTIPDLFRGKKFFRPTRAEKTLFVKRADSWRSIAEHSFVEIASGRTATNTPMYNKLFTKILDSSVWLEPTGTRLVWLTLIAAMDEDGFSQFASVANLAHRANIPLEDTQRAVACLEGPDADSSDPEHEGRRIERVPGGWMVLNAPKYREMVSRIIAKEGNRRRVQRFREKERAKKAKKPKKKNPSNLRGCMLPDHPPGE